MRTTCSDDIYLIPCSVQRFEIMSRKRKVLSLAQRLSVIKKWESSKSCRGIAEELGVGKTQIQTIIQERKDIVQKWEAGERPDMKYSKPRMAGYEDLDKIMWEWFTRARSKNISVSGRMVQEKALVYAKELGHDSFTASNGWLDRWQKRHSVRMSVLSGESADVDSAVVEDWSKRLSSICSGYKLEDIFNADETGLFYRAMPTRSLVVKGD